MAATHDRHMTAKNSGTADPRYSKRLAVVVPYRNRADHLAKFVPHVAAYFERDKRMLPIVPGMRGYVDIRTGRRTLLDRALDWFRRSLRDSLP